MNSYVTVTMKLFLASVLALAVTQVCGSQKESNGLMTQNGNTSAITQKTQPRFDLVTKNVTVVAGQTAVLPCTVENLGKSFRVVWMSPRHKTLTLQDRRIITDERISLERPYVREWNLHIRKVMISDAGIYQCQINTNPVQLRQVMLHVQEPAHIIGQLSSALSVMVREGETIELVCNVTGFPTPTVTWYRIHAGLSKEERGGASGKEQIGMEGEVLVIHNVSRYCDDRYQCLAFNGVPPADSREIRVHVQFPPEVRLPNKKIGQIRGRSTILECQITAYPHSLNKWRRNGEDIIRGSKYSTELYNEGANKVTLSLKVQSLTAEDYGEYECVSENALGRDSQSMLLYEYRSPVKKTTTTTTTTTTTRRPWVSSYDRHSNYDPQFNDRDNDDGGGVKDPDRPRGYDNGPWSSGQKDGEDRQRGSDTYPSYGTWRNPEYNSEEGESKSVISDPDGNGAVINKGLTSSVITIIVWWSLCFWLGGR
ncbi:limbic system-associated membrane protein [Aplysia californica]|uniref:Limbic system-associated membrane protein n=1 Tax=Aplysia californica TaxID=6500 RepID=A0ABM1AAQ3_APLCA|nr:limbic system-associated membrane protein [Aplysia californica]XP_012944099.1 limbic system-associated membrane protein [Aplysia californica]